MTYAGDDPEDIARRVNAGSNLTLERLERERLAADPAERVDRRLEALEAAVAELARGQIKIVEQLDTVEALASEGAIHAESSAGHTDGE